MFMTSRVFGIVVKTKDDAYALALSAFDASHQLAIAAKENEIAALRKEVSGLAEQLRYERTKSDGLVDRLLVRDARVAAVAPAAVELAKHKDAEAVKKLSEIFDQMNEMGAEIPAKDTRAFEFAGGGAAVSR